MWPCLPPSGVSDLEGCKWVHGCDRKRSDFCIVLGTFWTEVIGAANLPLPLPASTLLVKQQRQTKVRIANKVFVV